MDDSNVLTTYGEIPTEEIPLILPESSASQIIKVSVFYSIILVSIAIILCVSYVQQKSKSNVLGKDEALNNSGVKKTDTRLPAYKNVKKIIIEDNYGINMVNKIPLEYIIIQTRNMASIKIPIRDMEISETKKNISYKIILPHNLDIGELTLVSTSEIARYGYNSNMSNSVNITLFDHKANKIWEEIIRMFPERWNKVKFYNINPIKEKFDPRYYNQHYEVLHNGYGLDGKVKKIAYNEEYLARKLTSDDKSYTSMLDS